MNCPECGGKTYIIDTRISETDKQSIRRRRLCYRCRGRFTTYEVTDKVFESGEKAKQILKQVTEFTKGLNK